MQNFGVTDNYSFKELYDVCLKATYNMKVGDREFVPNETVFEFDKIFISTTQELKSHIAARGGFDNRAWVNWDETKEVGFYFSQGVFSKAQFGLLSNSKLIEVPKKKIIYVPMKEEKESDENGVIKLDHIPYCDLFIYEKETGNRIMNYGFVDGEYNQIKIDKPYVDVLVRYCYNYDDGGTVIRIGQRLIEGYLRLEGKTRLKDDNTGRTVTALITMPRFKLMSDLSMRLGPQANPVVANFYGIAYPVGGKGDKQVVDYIILNQDIDADM